MHFRRFALSERFSRKRIAFVFPLVQTARNSFRSFALINRLCRVFADNALSGLPAVCHFAERIIV